MAGVSGLLCRIEALENNVCELAIHERVVDVSQNATRLRVNDADVMHATGTDSNDFAMHQRFDQLWRLADSLDAVVVG